MKKLTTRQLMLATLFATISLIFTRFFATYLVVLGSNSVRISLGNLPLYLAGLLLGPLAGGLAGIGADLMGMLFFPSGAYFPGFTLTACLSAVIPALLKKKMKSEIKWPQICGILMITETICSVGLNTLWLHILYGIPYFPLLPPRILVTAIMVAVNTLLLAPLYRRLKREM